MPRIPFIEARFFDPTEKRHTLEQRFRLHLQQLREAKGDEAYDLSEILGPDPESICSSPLVGTEDVRKISRRTKRLLDRRDASSGLAHLKPTSLAPSHTRTDLARSASGNRRFQPYPGLIFERFCIGVEAAQEKSVAVQGFQPI